jgi:hypothetical protein
MLSRALFLMALLLSTAPLAGASAQSPEGRWQSERPVLILDIAACPAGWCGVVVDGTGACGAQVLQFAGLAPPFPGRLDEQAAPGRLDLPGRPGLVPRVSLDTLPGGRAPMLSILAVDAPEPAAFLRRIFPFQAQMARLGPSRCQAPPVS